MTPFTKQNLIVSGDTVVYTETGAVCGEGTRFVARFKRGRGGPSTFMTCLRKNFDAETYFARIDAGETPSDIAESAGWVSPMLKRVLKSGGYPTNAAGLRRMRADRRANPDRWF